jgi:hypothetical protein
MACSLWKWHSRDAEVLTRQKDAIEDCRTSLRDIITIMESATPREGKPMQNAAKKLLWPLKKSETEAHLKRLERHKTTFSLALSAEQLLVSFQMLIIIFAY